jgi:hypothetical protein
VIRFIVLYFIFLESFYIILFPFLFVFIFICRAFLESSGIHICNACVQWTVEAALVAITVALVTQCGATQRCFCYSLRQ